MQVENRLDFIHDLQENDQNTEELINYSLYGMHLSAGCSFVLFSVYIYLRRQKTIQQYSNIRMPKNSYKSICTYILGCYECIFHSRCCRRRATVISVQPDLLSALGLFGFKNYVNDVVSALFPAKLSGKKVLFSHLGIYTTNCNPLKSLRNVSNRREQLSGGINYVQAVVSSNNCLLAFSSLDLRSPKQGFFLGNSHCHIT